MSTIVLLAIVITTRSVHAQNEITPFIGYGTGGSVGINGLNTSLDDRPAFGVFVTFDRGPGRKLDLVFSHEQTRASRHDPFEEPVSTDVTLDYFQIGGRYVFTPDQRTAPYIAMTIGGARVAIEGGSGVRFAYAFGGGADLRLTRKTALRLDGRFTTTFVEANAQIGCASGGTCSGFGNGSALTQFTASAGLVVHF